MTLVRKTPLKRKAATRKRGPAKTCSTQRCGRRPSVEIAPDERYCKTHAMRLADKLVGDYVKDWYGRRCIAKDHESSFWSGPVFNCSGGAVQWAHLIPRGYKAVRHSPDNAVSLCPAHHLWFDLHPVEREDMIRNWLGDEYDAMRALARTHVASDLADTIIEFRKRVAT